jgi:protein SCO1/2
MNPCWQLPAMAVMSSALALAVAGPSSAAEEQAAHDHSMHDHAAHQAAMQQTRYTVSSERYAIPDVKLLDADGKTVALRQLLDANQPVALNFIFTTCTTICPVMTATFAQMRRALGEKADGLLLVSVSIDPEYDRPAELKAYAEQFGAGPGWTFLTGESADIERVQRGFDAYAGTKLNHKPLTFLKRPGESEWIRIDGLASGESLAREVDARLLN